MRALVTWAADQSSNLGVRALAEGAGAVLTRVWPEIEVEYQNFGRGPSPLPLTTSRSLLRERVTGAAGMRDWLAGFDLVYDTRAGDSFTDSYGMRRLRTMTALAEFASQAGTPVVLGPQTLGPFDTRAGRLAARLSLRRAALVMARDSASARFAAGLGRPVDLLTTDVVFALPTPDVPRSRDVLLNVPGLLWQESPHVDAAAYRRTVASVYRGLTDAGRRVDLVAHVLRSPVADNDVPAIEEFAATVAPEAEVLVPTDLQDVRRMVASAELVVGSRMHACLNALSVGTPAIPLAYSRKFAPLLDDLGWGHTIDLRTHEDPAAAALAAARHEGLRDEAVQVRDRAHRLLAPAYEALAGLR